MQIEGHIQAYNEIMEAINYSKSRKVVREWFTRHKFDPTNEIERKDYITRVLSGKLVVGNPFWTKK